MCTGKRIFLKQPDIGFFETYFRKLVISWGELLLEPNRVPSWYYFGARAPTGKLSGYATDTGPMGQVQSRGKICISLLSKVAGF